MKTNMNNRKYPAVAGIVLTALLAGCHTERQHGESFAPDTDETSTGRMARAQAAAGAKEDGTLYDMNFHGPALNSLGQGKLDLMVKASAAGDPVMIYLKMPHDAIASRQAAVTEYLKADGIADAQIIVVEGSNPNLSTPTAYNLGGIYKQDGGTFSGAAAVDQGAGGGGGLAGAAGK